MKNWFSHLQNIGKALMLPVAVLPAAALLLRLGASDVFDIPFVTKAGGAVFDNLPLIFAIGIAVGFAKDGHGSAGLAGSIGYLTLTAGLKAIDDTLNMGVLAGIISGLLAGSAYNRFHATKLPDYLAFFSGKRFVPIATAAGALILAAIFGAIWGPCQGVIRAVGEWIIGAGAFGVFVYGVLNRLLIPFGLHHILNSFIWFVFGEYTNPETGVLATGDLNRFFAGDPTAGTFMSGFFPMMMFGLPAVALAFYHAADKKNRAKVAGALASVAFASFLTGITEPIEFMFMFLSPLLYGIHAVLTGLSMAIAYSAGSLSGFGFSAGFIDFALNWGLSTHPERLIYIGIPLAVIYYAVFYLIIKHFDLATPGRYDEQTIEKNDAPVAAPSEEIRRLAQAILEHIGGAENIASAGSCITRLRLEVKDESLVNVEALKKLPLKGVFAQGKAVQAVIGLETDTVAREFDKLIK